ncbi:MAG: hypothetical protein HY820_17080 [Acidobacteria bacterium]|nr:hypothetical protein [Acidobacteriota bacterium]
MKFRGFLVFTVAALAIAAMTVAAMTSTGTIPYNLFTQAAIAEERPADEAGCTVANVAGTYGYAGFGTVLPGNPFLMPPGTYTHVGTLTLDGKGNVTIVDTGRVDDYFFPANNVYAAVYTVDSQCHATMSIPAFDQIPGVTRPHWRGVFVDNRKGYRAISMLKGLIINYVNTTRT